MLTDEEYKYFKELVKIYPNIEQYLSTIRLAIYWKFKKVPSELEIHMATFKFDTTLKKFLKSILQEGDTDEPDVSILEP